MKKLTIVFHSGYGHTEFMAKKVAEGASKVSGVEITLLKVGHDKIDWSLLKASDAIIFGSPTYMGNVSGPFKQFMDDSSKAWMTKEWRNKLAAGFTVSGSPSGDKLSTLQYLNLFAMQHGMIWVGYDRSNETYAGVAPDKARNRVGSHTGLMAQAGNDAPEKSFVEGDLLSGIDFGERVATVLAQNLK